MKYLVNISYTNPAHEHVSLRRRVDTINRIVEARSEEEALNRAANQQRALGFLVREAKVLEEAVSFGRSGGVMHYDPKTEKSEKPAKGVSALDKDGNLVGHYKDLETAKKNKPGHTYQTSKGVAKEEVEQIDELKKSTLASYVNKAANQVRAKSGIAASFETQGARKRNPENKTAYWDVAQDYRKGARKRLTGIEKATSKLAKEEIEQTDEALLPKQQAVADKLKASELAANKEKAGYKFGKGLRAAKVAAKMQKEETEVQYIEEKLTAADPASEWIKDFVASDNPKFEGKSKKERIQMALGAYYAAKRAKNEATEKKYNEKEVKHAEKKQDKKQGTLNKIEMEPEIEMHSKGVK